MYFLLVHNPLSMIIRYLSSICLAVVCLGLPLHAKTTTTTTKGSANPSSPAAPASKAKCDKSAAKATSKNKSTSSTATSTASTSKKSGASTARSIPGNAKSASSARSTASTSNRSSGRLARLTAYWAGEGDYYTGRGQSATGVRLHDGHCAVDPHIIPYGSVVEISGLGSYLAVDTGSAVISREAARATGHNAAERGALVVDIYFESRRDGERFAASGPKFATVTWRAPRTADNQTKEKTGLIAEQNWSKDRNRDL